MKYLILAAAFLSSAIVFASTPSVESMCISLTGSELDTGKILGTGKCEVEQTMSQAELGSTWSCSFNGKAAKKLKTVATWVTAPGKKGQPTIFYDVYPQEDLGSYLLNGMNIADAIDGPLLEVNLENGKVANPNLMITTGFSSYDALNVNSVKFGKCTASR
jgi:hypothetical protein